MARKLNWEENEKKKNSHQTWNMGSGGLAWLEKKRKRTKEMSLCPFPE